MKYKKLRIANYRGVEALEVEFQSEGLTLIQGPNEVGKTSLGEAIRILFDYQDSSSHKEVRAIRPVHRDEGAEIELEATTGPYQFSYLKKFHKKPETRLTIQAPKPENHTGREAHDRALEMLKETLDIDLWKALTIQQGDAIALPNLGNQQSLSAALDKAAGGVPTEPAEEDLFGNVRKEFERFFGAKGQEKKDLKETREKAEAAEVDVARINQALEQLDEDIEKAARLQKEVTDLKERERGLTEELAAYRKSLTEIKELESAVREAKLKQESVESSLKLAKKNQAEREELARSLSKTRKEYEQLAQSSKEWMPNLERAKTELKKAETAWKEANQNKNAKEKLAKIRRDDVEYYNNLLFLEQLAERKSRIDEAQKNAAYAEELLRNNQVDEALIKAIASAERELLIAKSRLETAAPKVQIQGLKDCRIQIDGSESSIQAEEVQKIPVSDHVDIVIPDLLEIHVAAGSSIDELTRKVSEAQQAIDSACRKAGVSDPESARTAFESRQAAIAEIAKRSHLEQENLRDLTYEELSRRLLELQETVPKYDSDREVDPAIAPDLDAANTLRKEAEQSLEDANAELEAARQRVESAQDRRDQVHQNYETDRVNITSLENDLERLTARMEAAREVQSDEALESESRRAEAAFASEVEKVRAAENSLEAKRPEQVKQKTEAAEGSLETTKKRSAQAEKELTEVQTRLKIHGEEGLHEKLQAAETKRQRCVAESRALARHAAAAKLLYDIMKQERKNVRQAYVAPLKERVERLARFVFDHEVQIELDENLQIASRTDRGVTIPFDSLSGGAKEQLSLIYRLACSMIVAVEGGMPLIMDDALGYTDPERLKTMGAVLARAAKECQIVILTCMPQRYSHIGEASVVSL